MNPKSDSMLEGAARYLGLATAALAIVYALAYLLGYFYLRSFYDELGAVWALDLYGTVAVAQVPSTAAILAAFFAVNLATNTEVIDQVSWKVVGVLVACALSLLLIHWCIGRYWVEYVSHFHIAAYGAGVLAILAGVGAYAKEVFRKQGLQRGAKALVAIGFLAALCVTPILGESKASRIHASKGAELPLVVLNKTEVRHWRLVAAVPDEKLLLVRFVPGEAPVFRIVATTDPVAVLISGTAAARARAASP